MISEVINNIPPGLIMILGSVLILLSKNLYIRSFFVLTLPILTFALVWNLPTDNIDIFSIKLGSFILTPVYSHTFSYIFASVFSIAAFAGGLFGLLQAKRSELAAAFLYAGSAIGAVFSGDFISLFIFWEIMAIGSTFVLFASDFHGAKKAAMRYAAVHLFGGVIFMTGIIMHIVLSGSAAIVQFDIDMSFLFPDSPLDQYGISVWFILVGILINAAAVPFSAWLSDAYPKASVSGSVFLSAFTTKTAVFVLLTIFPGAEILIFVGLIMVFYGIIWAILENDVRRLLSYSIVNQVGFMIIGVGIGTPLALAGVAVHAFCHIVYKSLMFMSAGSVYYMTGKTRFTDLGGLWSSMKVTSVCAIIGGLSISAFPFTSGFVSKSLIVSAAYEEHMAIVWFLLISASALSFLYAGLKFPWFTFFSKDSGLRPNDPPANMQIAMMFLSVLCVIPAIPGLTEKILYNLLPYNLEYNAYTNEHVIAQIQLLLFSGLAFFVMLPMLKRTNTITLDFDWFYRAFAWYIIRVLFLIGSVPVRVFKVVIKKAFRKSIILAEYINGPDGAIARARPVGASTMWVLFMLGVYIIVYYI